MRLAIALGDDMTRATGIARSADELGLWGVEVRGPAGTETARAAYVAHATSHVRIIVRIHLDAEHPYTLAEEIAVLDNLSAGRAVALIEMGSASEQALLTLADALAGRVTGGSLLSPPPVQLQVPIWLTTPDHSHLAGLAKSPESLGDHGLGSVSPGSVELSGDLDVDRPIVDEWLMAGCTHLLVDWPSEDPRPLARHLAPRASMVGFPEIMSDMADEIEPWN
jgi:hypothetical protein